MTPEIKDHEVADLAGRFQRSFGTILADEANRHAKAHGNPPIYDSGDYRGTIVTMIKEWRTEMGRDRVETCEWKEDDFAIWETACGEAFHFEFDGPKENKQNFCGYCGKPIKS